jgi:hypothetical protein
MGTSTINNSTDTNSANYITVGSGGILTDGSGNEVILQNLLNDINLSTSGASGTNGIYYVGTTGGLTLNPAKPLALSSTNEILFL